MKKMLVVLAAFLLVGVTNVSAMTESELEAKLTASYNINGTTFKANASQVNQIKQYLAKNEISSSDADYIASAVDRAVEVIKSSGAKSFKEIDSKYKDQLSSIAKDVTKNTAVKVTLSNDGTVSVYNTDGTLFTKATSSIIKRTGAISLLGATSAVGAIYIARKVRKEN